MKIGRNDPCWCGSGKKFKKCHLNREYESPPPLQQCLLARKLSYGKQYCLHPNAGAECKGNIIKAHTIQRSGGLSRIAKNGHVYTFFPDHLTMLKGGELTARLVGVKNASTFTGFCGFHDNQTFEPIEKHAFLPNQEQAFLLGYRAICRELFGKRAQLELIPFSRQLDRGQPLAAQIKWQDHINYWTIGVQRGMQDFQYHKSLYDDALLGSDYSDVRFYILELDGCPNFMCCGGVQPDYDFAGKQLQSLVDQQLRHKLPSSIGSNLDEVTREILSTREISDAVAFSVIATDGGGAVVFTWIGESQVCEQLVSSLDSLTDPEIPHAVVRFAFRNFENIFASPSWWESLDNAIKRTLLLRQRYGGFLDVMNPSCMADDGVRAVSWVVKARTTNCHLA